MADSILADTGFLVGLHSRTDPYHATAVEWFRSFRGLLLTSEAVVTETAFFLESAARVRFVTGLNDGYVRIHAPDTSGRQRIAELIAKYADLDVDYADCSLVWLAELARVERILTIDSRDFAVLKIRNRRRFNFVDWR